MKVTLILGEQTCFHETYQRSCDPRVHPARSAVQQTLSHLYKEATAAFCGCRKTKQPLDVVTNQSRYYLVPVAGTHHLHNQACPFYLAPKDENGRGQYADTAISEETGLLAIKLAYPLVGEETKAMPVAEEKSDDADVFLGLRSSLIRLRQEYATRNPAPAVSTGQQALSTEGFLHLLWEYSKNTGWLSANPSSAHSPRKWNRSAGFVRQICDRMTIEGWPLSQILLIVDDHCNESEWDKIIIPLRNWASMSDRHRSNRFLLGLPNFFRRKPEGEYELVLMGTDRTILVPNELFTSFRLNHPRNFIGNTIRLRKRSIALVAVTSDQDGQLIATSLGMMLADQQTNLPCRSEAAMRLATKLRGSYRHFEVPMDYDTGIPLPDFVLLDGQEAERIPLYVLADDEHEDRLIPPGAWVWDERKHFSPPKLPPMSRSKADKIAASIKAAANN